MATTKALYGNKNRSGNEREQQTVVLTSALAVKDHVNIIQFRGRAMIEVEYTRADGEVFEQFVPLHREHFERIAYPILGGVSRSRMADVFAYVCNSAYDLTPNAHLIAFGPSTVWNTRTLELTFDADISSVVWRSPYTLTKKEGPNEFILSLAGGDEDHYGDIMQSIAPLIMDTKPDGVIWWVGSGANGKSSLMDALYRIFPNQLASLTVKRLTDERDTPMLNGHLANVVKESSEGRIEDTQIYKSIGTHEDFRVHKFHSQDSVIVNGNMHHIFSANSIPSFNDKGYSARRRTHTVPFNERFESDPTFNDRTFTPDNLGHIITEMMRFALQLNKQHYQYKFSPITANAKLDYDAEANNAEEYAREIIADGVVGFESFAQVRHDYERWCASMGYTPLGVSSMRKAMTQSGFERITFRTDAGTSKRYRLKSITESYLAPYGMSRPGFYTLPGFKSDGAIKKEQEVIKQQAQQNTLGDW